MWQREDGRETLSVEIFCLRLPETFVVASHFQLQKLHVLADQRETFSEILLCWNLVSG